MTKASAQKAAFDRLAASDVDTISSTIRAAASASLVAGVARRLYQARAREIIWRLHAEFSSASGEAPDDDGAWMAPLHFYFCRTMLELGAAESAQRGYRKLLERPALLSVLEVPEVSQIKQLYARACLRSGRKEQALAVYHEMANENPADWLSRFQIGSMLSVESISHRRVCFDGVFAAAERAGQTVPGKLRSVIVEALLRDGELTKALGEVEAAMRADPEESELWLSMANVQVARGDIEDWCAAVWRFFEFNGLTPPQLVEREFAACGGLPIHMRSASNAGSVSGEELVTVIMTAHNAAATIQGAILSVLSQTYRNLRLIVVDDASDDGTSTVVSGLAAEDSRVQLVRSDCNNGTYRAKNTAIAAFPSEFYTFHDSDDWMHPQRIEQHLAIMRRHSGLALTTSQWFRMDGCGRAVVRWDGGYLYENPASMFIRREVIDKVGYFDDVRTGADSEFSWRIRQRLGESAFAHLAKPLAVGLQSEGSLTQSGPAAFDALRYSPVRARYWEAWVEWHRVCVIGGRPDRLFVPWPLVERPFEAPVEILP